MLPRRTLASRQLHVKGFLLPGPKKEALDLVLHHRRPQTVCVFSKPEHSATRACDVQSWETKGCKAEAHSSPETCRHRETNVKDCKRHAAQSCVTNKGLQGRGGHNSLELGDKCKIKDYMASGKGRHMNRNATWPAEKRGHQQ